ncbi:DMT family transporter [Pleionea litopenaei]|uniref:DMT family transporter n=1 Tax=Pleionea litopenaei TaxID=3070815 RepID=A0AA51RW45_9GAMM|nr:DMT family transporter [Pleionea sp. HL-JVS1]WMS88650.1 DMT family transporter [Pleionea sp. HL-JVS1]
MSLLTAVLWGLLPIALKGLLVYLDALTITWLRFVIAAVVLGAFLTYKNRLPSLNKLHSRGTSLLTIVVIVGLLGNYILYMLGLDKITPGGAQVMIQSAPMLLLIGSLILFKESFHFKQWFGLIIFCCGLLLFFNQRFAELINPENQYTIGILLIFIAGVLWAGYALAQKQLLKSFKSDEIMIMVYLAGSLVFLPLASASPVLQLDLLGWLLLLFCGANTLVAYGAFAEALDHWEASRVSATLALTPLLTLGFMQLTELFFPNYLEPEPLNALSFIGAGLVVVGSAFTALSKQKARKVEGADGVLRVDP